MAEQDNQNPGVNGKRFRYTGSSMVPTFKTGQVLYIRPVSRDIQAGDVIVYHKGDHYVVHRVHSVHSGGVRTRGDNNPMEDEAPIPLENVIGVVEKVDDWGDIRPVSGGKRGLWQARAYWSMRALYRKMLPWLGAPYRWLKKRRWVNRVWQPAITRIHLQTSSGMVIKYVSHGKTVATWKPEIGRFTCRKPYDLVIIPPQEYHK